MSGIDLIATAIPSTADTVTTREAATPDVQPPPPKGTARKGKRERPEPGRDRTQRTHRQQTKNPWTPPQVPVARRGAAGSHRVHRACHVRTGRLAVDAHGEEGPEPFANAEAPSTTLPPSDVVAAADASADHGTAESEHPREIYRRFAALRVFAGVPESIVRDLYAQGAHVSVAAGRSLYDDHTPDLDVFFLVHGSVRVSHATDDGRELVTSLRKAPTLVGHTEMIAESSAIGAVQTLERCDLVRVPRVAFREALRQSTALVANLLVEQTQSLVVATRQLASIAFDPVRVRVAKLLCVYLDRYGLPAPGGIKIRIPLSQESCANALGVNLRSVHRAMIDWIRDGVLVKDGNHYVVTRPAELQKVAAG
ncbi:MAG: Crp/Fnr family transcriptional regulator [Deltaproteobacteria bacterium]|nr:Crp/Fnr family transcriptional regulator [Deltaproteobacteria bacterium]